PPRRVRTFRAPSFITTWSSVTCPSPAIATRPSRRTERIVVIAIHHSRGSGGRQGSRASGPQGAVTRRQGPCSCNARRQVALGLPSVTRLSPGGPLVALCACDSCPRIDDERGARAVRDDERVDVHLFDRRDLRDERGQAQECVLDEGEVARLLAARAREQR